MAIIIGIDPGSRITGYGIIDANSTTPQCLHYGQVQCGNKPLAQRLAIIHNALQDVIHQFRPTEASIEHIFFHVNAKAALTLGQARGAALVALANADIPIHEYAPREIKQAVVGYGNAQKNQIQMMIRSLLKLTSSPPADAADALAIALCHCHARRLKSRIEKQKN